MAQDAAELIEIEYEDLPVLVEAERRARKRGGARCMTICRTIWPSTTNTAMREETERAFAGAAHVVKCQLTAQRIAGNPMEPKSCLARYDAADGSLRRLAAEPGHGPT